MKRRRGIYILYVSCLPRMSYPTGPLLNGILLLLAPGRGRRARFGFDLLWAHDKRQAELREANRSSVQLRATLFGKGRHSSAASGGTTGSEPHCLFSERSLRLTMGLTPDLLSGVCGVAIP